MSIVYKTSSIGFLECSAERIAETKNIDELRCTLCLCEGHSKSPVMKIRTASISNSNGLKIDSKNVNIVNSKNIQLYNTLILRIRNSSVFLATGSVAAIISNNDDSTINGYRCGMIPMKSLYDAGFRHFKYCVKPLDFTPEYRIYIAYSTVEVTNAEIIHRVETIPKDLKIDFPCYVNDDQNTAIITAMQDHLNLPDNEARIFADWL